MGFAIIAASVPNLIFRESTRYFANNHPPGQALEIPADWRRRKIVVSNHTGDPNQTVVPMPGEAWIFGRYRNGDVNKYDFDFVIQPGESKEIDAPTETFWLCCENGDGVPDGVFGVTVYY